MSPLIFQNIHLWEFTKSEIVYIIYGTIYRDVLFEFHLKFWNTISIGILFEVYYRVDSLLTGLKAHKREQLLNGNQIKHLYIGLNVLFLSPFPLISIKLVTIHTVFLTPSLNLQDCRNIFSSFLNI